jgi:hypothetical protein
MRSFLIYIALIVAIVTGFGANNPINSPSDKPQTVTHYDEQEREEQTPDIRSKFPVYLTANEMSIATGQPSLLLMSHGSTYIPVWSFSGSIAGQSVVGVVDIPSGYAAVKIEIVVITTAAMTNSSQEDVYRVHLSQMLEDAPFTARQCLGNPVRTALPEGPFYSRTIVLESYYAVVPHAPLTVRIQREPEDPADSFNGSTGLAMVKVTPVDTPPKSHVVQNASGYNSWPMIQAIGGKLVCVYSRGSGHTIGEDTRAVYARTSTDGGKTWTPETVVANTPDYGEVEVGKGLDSTGAMLLWVRRFGKKCIHDLYRTTDGVIFTLVATPELAVIPVQITDVFVVPGVGLMALWFAGDYGEGPNQSWGTVTSSDNGATWTQNIIESGLTGVQWPTEPSAVYLGDGKILAIGRTTNAQTQLESSDNGATWTRSKTNISDISGSTPSLILDAETGLLSNYYFHRGRGILRRRVVDSAKIFGHPLQWPASEVVATGSEVGLDSGNVNATMIGRNHYLAFYSGKAPDTAILVSKVPAPRLGGGQRR